MEIFNATRSMFHLQADGQPPNGIQSVLGSNGQASKIASQSATSKIRILYIEDEKDLVTLVQLIFSRKGYQIVGARTIAQAKEIMEREKIDLFFVDLNLPDGTGWEVLDYLGQHEQYGQTPKIIMSAQVIDQKRQMESGSKKRYSAVVGKPFQVNILLDVTQRLLDRYQPSH